jgi:hypothetical protein
MSGSPLISFLMFFQDGAAANTREQLRLFRRLITSLIVSMVERVLTQVKHCVAHSMIPVLI